MNGGSGRTRTFETREGRHVSTVVPCRLTTLPYMGFSAGLAPAASGFAARCSVLPELREGVSWSTLMDLHHHLPVIGRRSCC